MTNFVLAEAPCPGCPVESRCLETGLAMECTLIQNWVLNSKSHVKGRPPGAPNKIQHIHKTLAGIYCKYCNSSQVVKRGIRNNVDHQMQTHYCYDCGRRFSKRLEN